MLGLFRYAAQGYRTRDVFELEDPDGAAALDEKARSRWEEGCEGFSTMDELYRVWQERAARTS